ncbi:MAG: pentapeptide repeat-containing protein [Gammaproteobacteria bacterium]|nr:pentapeptide repeat-containing protein [Gammaproteobacteria bacterium]
MASRLVGLMALRLEATKLSRSIGLGHKSSIEINSKEGFVSGYIPSHNQLLELIARQWGFDSYDQFLINQENLAAYIDLNLKAGIWHTFRPLRPSIQAYSRCIEAIEDALNAGIPLAVAAQLNGANFDGFEFSDALAWRFGSRLLRANMSFAGLRARGALVSGLWASSVSSFVGADLREAKFYSSDDTGVIAPGIRLGQIDFGGANLERTDLRCSYFSHCSFLGVSMAGADLRYCHLTSSYFDSAARPLIDDIKRGRFNEQWIFSPDQPDRLVACPA